MEKMTEDIVIDQNKLDEEYVVNGEGCHNDCHIAWQSEAMGCKPNAWWTTKF